MMSQFDYTELKRTTTRAVYLLLNNGYQKEAVQLKKIMEKVKECEGE